MTDPTPITSTVEIQATPDVVWQVVSDLGRMPEFSPELRKAFVIGKPGVGANIVGINRRKAVVWPTTSKVVRWEPGHAVACTQASWSTHAPIGPMRPLRSAIGMNASGGMTPRRGWSQRSSASVPVIAPVRRSTWGW